MKLFITLAFTVASFASFTSKNTLSPKTTSNMEQELIARIWHGWTSKENAAALERVLRFEAIPSIEANRPAGLKKIVLLTLEKEAEVEFTTIMYFESMESVKKFAGQQYEKAHIDPAVAPLLLRYDHRVEHHRVKEYKDWE